jgi:DNA-binding PadR family transcriptional regulator
MEASAAENTTTGAGTRRFAMRSPVNWAVLGLVIERPGHGYALCQRFDCEYEGLLSATDSQVYAALGALKSRGLVEEVPGSRTVRSADQQVRTVSYRATHEGMHGFRERLYAQMYEDHRQLLVFLRQLATFAHEPEMGLLIVDRLERGYAEEARAVPIACPDASDLGVVPALAARLVAEEKRLATEAKLPLIRLLRREFEALLALGGQTRRGSR